MRLRPYEETDLEAVITVFRSNIPKYFSIEEEFELRSYLAENPDHYFIGEDGMDVIAAGGFALNADGTVSLCWGMVVADRFGERAVVISTSQQTRDFYERLGFVLTEYKKDGFGNGIDICKMRLDAPWKDELLYRRT